MPLSASSSHQCLARLVRGAKVIKEYQRLVKNKQWIFDTISEGCTSGIAFGE
jgi:hypothetical protein